MTFNLISLGLNLKSITAEALEAIKTSKKIYLETYTVKLPYTIKQLEKTIRSFENSNSRFAFDKFTQQGVGGRDFKSRSQNFKTSLKITPAPRELVESQELINQAKKQNISILVYGNCLSATTHITLITECIKNKIPYKIIHNSGIFEAIAETGLQLYKFGKTASLPAWKQSYKPKSFINIIKDNQKIKAHTLLLVDPELDIKQTTQQLQETRIKQKIIIAENLGNNPKIYYDSLDKLKNKKITQPFAIVVPAEMHFVEEDALELLSSN